MKTKVRESNKTYYPQLNNTEQLIGQCIHCKSKRLTATLKACVSARQFAGKWNMSGGFALGENVQYTCRVCGHVWGECEDLCPQHAEGECPE
ncbi:MAG: hypothetical protein HQ559_01640 [Lentisphaerae bacterium]|nr:hypothetical protein [Lentisphaerota bacterium]